MLGPLRQQLNLKSRRKKSGRIIARVNTRDGRLIDREMAVEEFPRLCIGFRWPVPGILDGHTPSETFEGELVVRYEKGSIEKHATDEEAIRIGRVSTLDFAQMLAKIAHSFAVAKYGQESFSPLLRDLILGRSRAAPFLIGSDMSGAHPDQQPNVLHDISRSDVRRDDGQTFLGVSIRLFAFFGMPRYHVIVGTRMKEGPQHERLGGGTIAVAIPRRH